MGRGEACDVTTCLAEEQPEKPALTKSMSKVKSLDVLWKGSKCFAFFYDSKHLSRVLMLQTHLAAVRPSSNLVPHLTLLILIAPDFAHKLPNWVTKSCKFSNC